MPKPTKSQLITIIAAVVVVLYIVVVGLLTPTGSLLALRNTTSAPEGQDLTYSRMMELVEADEVAKAYWFNGKFSFDTRDAKSYVVNEPIGFMLQNAFTKLSSHGVDVVFGPPSEESASAPPVSSRLGSAAFELIFVLTSVLPVAVLVIAIFLLRGLVSNKPGAGKWPPVYKNYPTRFSDVAGHTEVQRELDEIITFLKSPEAFAKVGARPPKGVLLVGPPGTGKTLMAKALAGECGATFIAVSGSDFSSMFVGQGKGKVKKLFDVARKSAPAIIFIDELDSIARKRGLDHNAVGQENDRMLNQLLVEMDGFDVLNQVIVVGATNRVDVLDPAVLRPGRFDRQVHVSLPDIAGRRDILAIHAKSKPLAKDVDLEQVAKSAPGFSGADLQNLVNEAAIFAARDARTEINAHDFQTARDKVIMGVSRPSMVIDPEEKRLIAFHEAGHALAATLSEHSDPVHQATIIPHGQSLGSVVRLPENDKVCTPKAKLLDDLIVLMAGRAAEEAVFGAEMATNGAASDIDAATRIATAMVCEWGMSPLGLIRGGKLSDGTLTEDAYKEVSRLVSNAHTKALQLVKRRRLALNGLAAALLKSETLTGDQVRELVSKHAEAKPKQPDLLDTEERAR